MSDPAPVLTLRAGVAALRRGGIVAFPTDTVYGLAAAATDELAQRRIFRIKGRPDGRPLILMAASVADLADHVLIDDRARSFMERHWPGALTLVLPGIARTSVGVRIPDHPLALKLLEAAGPLMTTSANLSGQPPSLTAQEAATLHGVAGVIDGGVAPAGAPSTVLDLTGRDPRVLREGAIAAADLVQ